MIKNEKSKLIKNLYIALWVEWIIEELRLAWPGAWGGPYGGAKIRRARVRPNAMLG